MTKIEFFFSTVPPLSFLIGFFTRSLWTLLFAPVVWTVYFTGELQGWWDFLSLEVWPLDLAYRSMAGAALSMTGVVLGWLILGRPSADPSDREQ